MKRRLFNFKKWKKTFVILLLIISSLLLNKGGGNTLKGSFFLLSSPLLNLGNRWGNSITQQFHSLTRSRAGLIKENSYLRQQINQLLYLKSLNQQQKKENLLLRKSLSLKEKTGIESRPAQTITKNFAQDWLIINQGNKEGVALNQPVITLEKVLVGKTVEIYPHSSKVELISHPGITLEVETLTDQDQPVKGLVKGKGQTKLKLVLVARDEPLQSGEILGVSNLSLNYPAGLLVGKIQKIKKDDVKPFQEAEIRPLFLDQNLDNLLIVTSF